MADVQANYDLPEAVAGDTFGPITFTVTQNGSPRNLTRATINLKVNGSNFWVTPTQIVLTTPASGIFTIPAQILSLAAGVYDIEIEIIFSGGEVRTYVAGTWTVI
jgi:hypothetical protein